MRGDKGDIVVISVKKQKKCQFVQRFIKFPFSSPERDGRIVLSLLLNFAFQGSFPIIFKNCKFAYKANVFFFNCQGSLI